jgi:DNA-binding transcriptional MerR regulator
MTILTVKDVLEHLGISRAKLYYMEETGKIPPSRRTSTGKRYYLPEDLAQIKQNLERGAKL